jgi:hypothetical protein
MSEKKNKRGKEIATRHDGCHFPERSLEFLQGIQKYIQRELWLFSFTFPTLIYSSMKVNVFRSHGNQANCAYNCCPGAQHFQQILKNPLADPQFLLSEMLPQFFLPQGYLTVGLTFRKLSQQHLHHR